MRTRVSRSPAASPAAGTVVLYQVFELLAETFKTLGDYSRVQIVWALSHGVVELFARGTPGR